MRRYTNIMIGSDPELFIIDIRTNTVVSAIGLIPGQKKNAYRPAGMPKGFGLQIDNILAEFNIPPAKTCDKFIHHINYMKRYISDYVKEKNPYYDILCVASQHVPYDQLQDEEAKQFGCDPSYNAYTEDVNPKPEGERTNLRSAGTHIHVSYNNPNVEDSIKLVKYMDLTLGLPSVIIDPDKERRILYGKSGEFRLVPYGVEYRSMSSYFISNDSLIKFLYDGTMRAIRFANFGIKLPDPDLVQKAINTGDTDLASSILSKYKEY